MYPNIFLDWIPYIKHKWYNQWSYSDIKLMYNYQPSFPTSMQAVWSQNIAHHECCGTIIVCFAPIWGLKHGSQASRGWWWRLLFHRKKVPFQPNPLVKLILILYPTSRFLVPVMETALVVTPNCLKYTSKIWIFNIWEIALLLVQMKAILLQLLNALPSHKSIHCTQICQRGESPLLLIWSWNWVRWMWNAPALGLNIPY